MILNEIMRRTIEQWDFERKFITSHHKMTKNFKFYDFWIFYSLKNERLIIVVKFGFKDKTFRPRNQDNTLRTAHFDYGNF